MKIKKLPGVFKKSAKSTISKFNKNVTYYHKIIIGYDFNHKLCTDIDKHFTITKPYPPKQHPH